MRELVIRIPFRVLFDTNVYGILAEEASPQLLEKIISSPNIIVYGFSIVRKELRDTPTKLKSSGKSFRNILLNYYDSLVKKHNLQITGTIEALAQDYSLNYTGGISREKLKNDFLIVACASIHSLDVVVSEDRHSMLSKKAIETYSMINEKSGLRTPLFYSVDRLKKLL